jgi:chromosome segregation ATPase
VSIEKRKTSDAVAKATVSDNACGEVEVRARNAANALSAREREINKLTLHLRGFQGDNEQLKATIMNRNRELERAGADIASMTRESQAVTVESTRLAADLADHRRKLQAALTALARAEHEKR